MAQSRYLRTIWLVVAVAAAVLSVLLLTRTPIAKVGARPHASNASNTYVLCLNKAGSAYKPKVRPRHCAIYGRNGSFAGGVNLKKIRWHNWGHRRARAKAIECGFHLPCEHIRARVRVRRLRERCGREVYTRLKARTKYGSSRVDRPGCSGPAH